MLEKLRLLEEEDPLLHVVYDDTAREIHVQLMGEVQLEILERLCRSRFGLEITFGEGGILYRETIAAPVEGVGHYEPLRHYAEVHLLLEPLERGQRPRLCEQMLDRCARSQLAAPHFDASRGKRAPRCVDRAHRSPI